MKKLSTPSFAPSSMQSVQSQTPSLQQSTEAKVALEPSTTSVGSTATTSQVKPNLLQSQTSFEHAAPQQAPLTLTPTPLQPRSQNPQMLQFTFGAEPTSQTPSVRPQVSEVLDLYGVDQPLGRPKERIVRWAAELHQMLGSDGGNLDATVDKIVQRDARRMVFFLQGALKIYRKQYPALEPHYQAAKQLEDLLGNYSRFNSLAQKAESMGFPDTLRNHFTQQRDALRTQIKETLHQQWLPDFHGGKAPALGELFSTLQQTQWATPEEDRNFLQSFFQRNIEKLSQQPFDMNELQGDDGLHELRRQLRWVSIYMVALDGAVTFPGADFAQIHADPKAAVEYPAGPEFESAPLPFSLDLYKKNQELVVAFGLLKDRGELAEDLIHGFVESGLGSMEQAEAQVMSKLGPSYTHQQLLKEAQGLYQEVQSTGHLQTMSTQFQAPQPT